MDHRKGMRSFAVASEFHSSVSPASFYLKSDVSLSLVSPSNTATTPGPSACLGREAHHPRTVLLAGPPPRSIQISQRWVFLVSPGLPPQPRRLPREEGTGFQRARSRRTATARLRGQGGAWGVGCFEALALSRPAASDEALTLRDHSERALRCSENLPIALLPCKLTVGGRQSLQATVIWCQLEKPLSGVLAPGRTRCPVDTTDNRRRCSGGPVIPLSATLAGDVTFPPRKLEPPDDRPWAESGVAKPPQEIRDSCVLRT